MWYVACFSVNTFNFKKKQLREDWNEHLAYSNLKYKFSYVKLSKYITGIFALKTGFLVIGFLDWYSAFGQQEIKINRLLSIGTKIYNYSNIVKVKEVKRLKALNGNIVDDPHFVVEFRDGVQWNSRDNGFVNYKQDPDIINFITSKKKLKYQILNLIMNKNTDGSTVLSSVLLPVVELSRSMNPFIKFSKLRKLYFCSALALEFHYLEWG